MSGQYAFGSTSLGPEAEATTCDEHYNDEGRACAWFTFMCEDLTSALDIIPTCHKGLAQSPIDLNSNVATPGDPGAIVFQDYDVSFSSLPYPAVLRIQNFAMQLDFEPSTGPAVGLAVGRSLEENLVTPLSESPLLEVQEKNRVKRSVEWPLITGGPLGSDK